MIYSNLGMNLEQGGKEDMNKRMIPRIVAIATVIAMVIVAIFGVRWKSAKEAFTASPKIEKTEVAEVGEQQVVDIKTPVDTEATTSTVLGAATSIPETTVATATSTDVVAETVTAAATSTDVATATPAATIPAQTTVVAETSASTPNTATATATTADNTPITVVVQMPNETAVQPAMQQQV